MKTVPKVIASSITGFVIFLILLAILNAAAGYVHNPVYSDIAGFFNTNLIFLFAMMLVGMANEILWTFYFPLNILAPVSGAVMAVMVITFIYKIWNFINSYLNLSITIPINSIYIIAVIISLVAGYIMVFVRGRSPEKRLKENRFEEWHKERFERKKERLQRKMDRIDRKLGKKNSEVEWSEVGEEFKAVFYNIAKSLNHLFAGNMKKKKKRR